MNLILFVIFAYFLHSASSTWLKNDINLTFYQSMPSLYKMDNFEECSEAIYPIEFQKQYCIINVNVVTRDNARVFKEIKRFSAVKKFHFNHTSLKYGICLNNCLNTHAVIKDKFKEYLNDKVSSQGLPIKQGRRVMLNKLANVCINKDLIDYHGVMAETTVDYCIYGDPLDDQYNRIFYVAIFGLIFLLSISAVYEVYRHHPTVVKRLENWRRLRSYLNAYSIKQNWRALTENNNVNLELDNELNAMRLFNIKLFLMFLFMISQVYRQITSIPFANPILVEKNINHFIFNMFTEENLVGVFFTISGIYTSFYLISQIKSSEVKFWRLILNAFNGVQNHTFPLFASSVIFITTVFSFLSNAPFWRHATLSEMENCITNWRYNLLMIHNYVNRDTMCLEPTWILAAHLHLLVFGMMLLLFVLKFPKYSKVMFGVSLSASIYIVAMKIFTMKLPPYAIITPEILRNNHLTKDVKFQEIFYPTHMNAGNFLIGLIFGYLLDTRANLKRFQSKLIGFASILTYFLLPATLKLLFQANYIKSSIGTALLGVYMKHHDGLLLSLILTNVVFKEEVSDFDKKFYSLPIFKFLEKLFLPAFFCQIFITKVFIANTNVLIELNFLNLIAYTTAIMITSYLAAIFVYVIIQGPRINYKRETEMPAEEKSEISTEDKKNQ